MDIINVSSELQNIKNINNMIRFSTTQTDNCVYTVMSNAQKIEELVTLRKILRSIKRGVELKKAVSLYSRENCPPNVPDDKELECECVECNDCWEYYLEKYMKDSNAKKV